MSQAKAGNLGYAYSQMGWGPEITLSMSDVIITCRHFCRFGSPQGLVTSPHTINHRVGIAPVCFGDCNGYGFMDLAIDVPNEDVSKNSIEDGGAVQIIYSFANGLSAVMVVTAMVTTTNSGLRIVQMLTTRQNNMMGFGYAVEWQS